MIMKVGMETSALLVSDVTPFAHKMRTILPIPIPARPPLPSAVLCPVHRSQILTTFPRALNPSRKAAMLASLFLSLTLLFSAAIAAPLPQGTTCVASTLNIGTCDSNSGNTNVDLPVNVDLPATINV